MTRKAISIIELFALLVALYFGYWWYMEPHANHEPAFAIASFMVLITEWFRRHLGSSIDPNKLAEFIETGQVLLSRADEDPLPIQEHNDWVDLVETYFKRKKRQDYLVRFSNFSEMVFYGDGATKSEYKKSINGRLRNLKQFIGEIVKSEA